MSPGQEDYILFLFLCVILSLLTAMLIMKLIGVVCISF